MEDLGNTSTVFKLKDGSEHLVGNPKNKIKLTQLGMAYSDAVDFHEKSPIHVENKHIEFHNLVIITPPTPHDDLFIETGLQKHLLAAYDSTTDTYVIIHYFTSKNTAVKLSDKQLKIFQNEQEHPENNYTSKKPQNIVALKTPRIINKKDVNRVYKDQEYLSLIEDSIQNKIKEQVKDILQLPAEEFNKRGINCIKNV